MMQYADWMREAPADAPMMTPDEWLALVGEMQQGYCALCEEPATDAAPLVETRWGLMHAACADSEEEEVTE